MFLSTYYKILLPEYSLLMMIYENVLCSLFCLNVCWFDCTKMRIWMESGMIAVMLVTYATKFSALHLPINVFNNMWIGIFVTHQFSGPKFTLMNSNIRFLYHKIIQVFYCIFLVGFLHCRNNFFQPIFSIKHFIGFIFLFIILLFHFILKF